MYYCTCDNLTDVAAAALCSFFMHRFIVIFVGSWKRTMRHTTYAAMRHLEKMSNVGTFDTEDESDEGGAAVDIQLGKCG